ncbi:MAG: hypothetical protein RR211_02515 [Pseudoflavonifractor sp.]
MQFALEILVSLLAATGLLALIWLVFGGLLVPIGSPLCAVLPARGDGARLEHDVAGLVWLRGGGLLRAQIIIADCGLTPEGKQLAALLAQRDPDLVLCLPEDLPRLLAKGSHGG